MTSLKLISLKIISVFSKNCVNQKSRYYSVQFREKFVTRYGPTDMTSWYPGHMYRGMLQVQAKLAVTDCIIEVHDARIPFSGRNPNLFNKLSVIRPHILVLNKCDLADISYKEEVKRYLQQENFNHVIYTNCRKQKEGIQKIVPLAVELIKDTDLFNRGNRSSFMIMIVGVPNVGKSSLINKLRNYNLKRKSASAVGAVPGITKSVLEKIKVSSNPDVYLLDSPGILEPRLDNLEVGLKLALCRTLKDSHIGLELIADYLLYWLNKHKNFSYVEYLNLEKPTDDLRCVIFHIARNLNMLKKVNNTQGSIITVPDIERCTNHFLESFREGKFGKVLLDVDVLQRK